MDPARGSSSHGSAGAPRPQQTAVDQGPPGGFNWPELGREEIPAALRMILPCLRLRSPLGLVASRGRGQDTGDPRHVGGLRFGLAMGRRSEERAFTGCMLRANSAWFVGWGGLDLVISLSNKKLPFQ